ncbi:MAG TPA: MmcQ/YjbR family DNA-binding protein [Chitinophagaceae bacterium]
MVTPAHVRQFALSLPEAEEQDHRGKPSFRVRKKIFAVLHAEEKRVVLKLSTVDQSVFDDYDPAIFYPVEGAWGRQGWTVVELSKVKKEVFREALVSAWLGVAPKTLAKKLELLNY